MSPESKMRRKIYETVMDIQSLCYQQTFEYRRWYEGSKAGVISQEESQSMTHLAAIMFAKVIFYRSEDYSQDVEKLLTFLSKEDEKVFVRESFDAACRVAWRRVAVKSTNMEHLVIPATFILTLSDVHKIVQDNFGKNMQLVELYILLNNTEKPQAA